MHRLLIGILLCAFAASAVSATDLKLKEAGQLQLHSLDDLLSWVPEESLSSTERDILKRDGVFRITDSIMEEGTYTTSSSFESNHGGIASALWVVSQTEEPMKVFGEIYLGAELEAKERDKVLEEMYCSEDWFDQCKLSVIRNSQRQPIGNVFLVREGRSIYMVTHSGFGAFELPEDAKTFFDQRASTVLKFSPNAETIKLELAARNTQQNVEGVMRFWTNVFGYFVLYSVFFWSVAALNAIAKRTLLPRRTSAVVGMFLVATLIAGFVHNSASSSDSYARMEPFEQGQVLGKILAEYFLPLIVICVGALIRRLMETRGKGA